MNRILLTISLLILSFATGIAQYPGWQQAVDYTMDVTVDTAAHQYSGSMKVVLRNNSSEALDKAYFHLFFNAFQPGSMMDVRSRTISDPDRRVGSRIFELPEDEWGWIEVASLRVNGKPVALSTMEPCWMSPSTAPSTPAKRPRSKWNGRHKCHGKFAGAVG